MAFPVDAARAGTNGSTAATNKVCNLPTGISAGDLLILILRSAGADTHSTPTGWNALVLNNTADPSDDTTSVFYRVADGNEGSTVTVNGTASLKFAAYSWRITGAGTPQISTAATGTSTLPNPPSFSPTGGAQDYLWLWLGGWEGEQTSPPSGQPTNYINPVGANSGTAGATATNCQVAGASRQLNAATEDPPSWTISVSDDWTAFTLAAPPFVASPTRGRISWTELEVPAAPTRGRISWAELEAPLALTRGRISWAELETPMAPTRGRISWAELEAPLAPTRGRLSWTELEVPDVVNPTRGRISWAEVEAPFVLTRGRVSQAEFELPLAPTRGRLSYAELEVPLALTRGRISWAELEAPFVPTRGRVSQAEFELPLAPTRARISQAELEVPSLGEEEEGGGEQRYGALTLDLRRLQF